MKIVLLVLPILLVGCVKESSIEDIKPVTSDMLESNVLHVVLRPNKKMESNGRTFESDEITKLIKEGKEEIDSVFLAADPNTRASEVVRIIDLIKAEGIKKIYVSTLEE